MKKYRWIAVVALAGLAGCSHLSDDDRALLQSANQAAQEAKTQSTLAAEEARKAREDAERSAAAAEAASEKADRIFQQGQKK